MKSASPGTAAASAGVTTVGGTTGPVTSCGEIAEIIVNMGTNRNADFDGDGYVTIWDLFAAFAGCE